MPTEIKSARDALEKILWCLNWMSDNTGDQPTKDHLVKPIELAQAALALPRRNCEVGTMKEKMIRFVRFCKCQCTGCPLETATGSCVSAWAQMPYEARKGGDE